MICNQPIMLSRRLPVIESLFNHVSKMPPSQFSRQLLMKTANFSLDSKKENDYLVKANSSIVISRRTKKFRYRITHALQQRDYKEVRKEFFYSPGNFVYDDAEILNELLLWVEELPPIASKLVPLFMNTIVRGYYHLKESFAENFIHRFNKISHLPPFVKVEVGDDRKCPNCLSNFEPKPILYDKRMTELSRALYVYAKNEKVPSREIETLHSCAICLLKWKKEFSLPICLADVPNIIHGNIEGSYHLADRRYLPFFLDERLPNFSAVGLISKFDLPDDTTQELARLKRVVYYKTYNGYYSDDLILLLMFTKCGKDTYMATNDRFHDHMYNLKRMKCSPSLTIIFNIIGSRCLKFNKSTGVLEKPCEISPFVHKTSTGYHFAIRRPLDENGNAYDYYCCHKLF